MMSVTFVIVVSSNDLGQWNLETERLSLRERTTFTRLRQRMLNVIRNKITNVVRKAYSLLMKVVFTSLTQIPQITISTSLA